MSPCSIVVAWQPCCDDKPLTLWSCGRLQKSVSIWPRVNHVSYLFPKSQQIFTSKWQILPDLCAERAIIRYNLLAVISNRKDNKLVILLPRPGCFFLLAPTSTYNCFILHLSISFHFSVADLHLFFFTAHSHPVFPLSLLASTSLAKYLGNEDFLSHRKRFLCFFFTTH